MDFKTIAKFQSIEGGSIYLNLFQVVSIEQGTVQWWDDREHKYQKGQGYKIWTTSPRTSETGAEPIRVTPEVGALLLGALESSITDLEGLDFLLSDGSEQA